MKVVLISREGAHPSDIRWNAKEIPDDHAEISFFNAGQASVTLLDDGNPIVLHVNQNAKFAPTSMVTLDGSCLVYVCRDGHWAQIVRDMF